MSNEAMTDVYEWACDCLAGRPRKTTPLYIAAAVASYEIGRRVDIDEMRDAALRAGYRVDLDRRRCDSTIRAALVYRGGRSR